MAMVGVQCHSRLALGCDDGKWGMRMKMGREPQQTESNGFGLDEWLVRALQGEPGVRGSLLELYATFYLT
jgi:hypothetical protein